MNSRAKDIRGGSTARRVLGAAAALLLLALPRVARAAPPPAGTLILSQGKVTYTAGTTTKAVQSNTTVATVSGVKLGLTITASKPSISPGDPVDFTAKVENLGATDAFPTPITVDGTASTMFVLAASIPRNSWFTNAATPAVGAVVYHVAGDAATSFVSAPPSDPARIDRVVLLLSNLPAGQTRSVTFTVKTYNHTAGVLQSSPEARYQFSAGSIPIHSVGGPASVTVKGSPPKIEYYLDATWAKTTSRGLAGQPLYVQALAPGANLDASRIETPEITLTSRLTGDTEKFVGIETGPNTGMFRLMNAGKYVPTKGVKSSGAMTAADGTLQVMQDDVVEARITSGGTALSTILIDPLGVVFNSRTNAPIAGVTVALFDVTNNVLATVFQDDGVTPAPNTVVTGADGRFRFPRVAASVYRLQVTVPAAVTFPSVVPVAQLPAGRIIHTPGSFGGNFPVNLATGDVHLDVPVDDAPTSGLFVRKTATRQVVEIGDHLEYEVQVRNVSAATFTDVVVDDVLPRGFAYRRGSARLVPTGGRLADPSGGIGPRLRFSLPDLASGAERTFRYRVLVGPGSPAGRVVNRAQASATMGAATVSSNVSSAAVLRHDGIFGDRGTVFGRVWHDRDGDGWVDAGEPGVPGVRLYMENGSFVITDPEGKFHFHGVVPRTHVLKLDEITLPAGAEVLTVDSRQGRGRSTRFVDIQAGELHKANFALGGGAQFREAVARRREARGGPDETDRAFGRALRQEAGPAATGDLRSRPASGVLGGGEVRLSELQPGGHGGAAAAATGAAAEASGPRDLSVPRVEFDDVLPGMSPELGFVDLADGALLPRASTAVRIKGPAGAVLGLRANGREVGPERVGTRASHARSGVQLLEYVGVELEAGENVLEAVLLDPFGNERGRTAVKVLVPGALAAVHLEVPGGRHEADGRTPVAVAVELRDARGTPVLERTPVTLEATRGDLRVRDIDAAQPGVQVLVEGGRLEVDLMPSQEPGVAELRVKSGDLEDEARVRFTPFIRPLMVVGIVEGKIRRGELRMDAGALAPLSRGDPFERELEGLTGGPGKGTRVAGRVGLFLKGKIKGDRLLTLAYDSERSADEKLFRDIDPDEYYPIYGDSAIQGFDAQSTAKLYVRVDQGASHLLHGDFDTREGAAPEVALGSYARSFNGTRVHAEGRRATVTAFGAQGSFRQVIDEFPANGTSGPYQLTRTPMVPNSEKVEILVRDREQPGVVREAREQTRFSDYMAEWAAGRILFKAPVASLTPELHSVTIRVTYEVEGGGEEFWTRGVRGQVKVDPEGKVRVGGSFVRDGDPADPSSLRSAHVTFEPSKGTRVTLETARSESARGGRGHGRRLEVRHDGERVKAGLTVGKTSAGFDNPSAPLSKGRSEMRARVSVALDRSTTLDAEAFRTADEVTRGRRSGQRLSATKKLRNGVVVEAGVRRTSETARPAQASDVGVAPEDTTTVRARVAAPLGRRRKGNAHVEFEQDVDDSDRRLLAVGADHALGERSRVYARHELISSLGGKFALNSAQGRNTTVFGIESKYSRNGRVFSEYRGRDGFGGRQTEAALGLRNGFDLGRGFRANVNLEQVKAFEGKGEQNALAAGVGFEYTGHRRFKASTRFEKRNASQGGSFLHTLSMAYKLRRDWSALMRYATTISESTTPGLEDRELTRLLLGVAYRPTENDRVNGLLRYERRDDVDPAGGSSTSADIVAAQWNFHPSRKVRISGRAGWKRSTDTGSGLRDSAVTRGLGARISVDLGKRWDVSVQAASLWSDAIGSQEKALGVELGRKLKEDVWLGVGYNFQGFDDGDLLGDEFSERGVYFRIRAKFDEGLFGRRRRKRRRKAEETR